MDLINAKILYQNASQAYYETGEVIMTDKEFDELEETIRSLDPNCPLLSMTGRGYNLKGIDEKEKFNHPLPMGSIDKEKSREVVLTWLKNDSTFSTKIDGNSVAVYYRDGNLWKVITRGKDDIGIDRTAKFITCESIPKKIPTKGYVRVRGEAAIKKSDYTEKNGFDITKACRNAVAGAISRQTDWEDVFKYVDFIAYDYRDCDTGEDISDNDWSMFKREEQKPIGEFYNMDIESFKKKYKTEYEYDADGIVFKKGNDLLAFKFEDESVNTQLLSVLWKTGKDQRLTPVAKIKPVQLAGATIENASLGSYSRAVSINAWPVGFEHVVKVIRANEIIPYIVETVHKSFDTMYGDYPTCVCCNTKSKKIGEHVFCVNPNCSNIQNSRLLTFCSFFYPEGLSDTIITKFFESENIQTITELVNYNKVFKKEVYGIGDSHRTLINQFLQSIKQEIDIRFVYRTFISGCGRRASEKIVDSGFTINEYDVTRLYSLSNFNSNIIAELIAKKNEIQNFCSLISYVENKKQKAKGTFCITGVRFKPDQLKNINDLGWTEDSSVTKTTSVLVVKDTNTTSGKADKARKNGTPVMSVEEFMNYIKG